MRGHGSAGARTTGTHPTFSLLSGAGMSPTQHPYTPIAELHRTWLLIGALVVLGAALVGLAVTTPALMTPLAPWGIVSWQLAGSGEQVAAILAEWGAEGRAAARTNLRVDLAFAPAYGLVIGLIAVRLAARLSWRRPAAGMASVAAWAALLAALSDLAENALMLWVLSAGPSDELAVATRALALVKFGSLGVALVLVLTLLRAAFLQGRPRPAA